MMLKKKETLQNNSIYAGQFAVAYINSKNEICLGVIEFKNSPMNFERAVKDITDKGTYSITQKKELTDILDRFSYTTNLSNLSLVKKDAQSEYLIIDTANLPSIESTAGKIIFNNYGKNEKIVQNNMRAIHKHTPETRIQLPNREYIRALLTDTPVRAVVWTVKVDNLDNIANIILNDKNLDVAWIACGYHCKRIY